MPYLNIKTNQAISDEAAFIKKASATVAKGSGKPESYVMISVELESQHVLVMAIKERSLDFGYIVFMRRAVNWYAQCGV